MSIAAIDRCYWNELAQLQDHAPLRGEVRVDIAVIGGGVVGVVAARLLKDRGLTVAVVEADHVGLGVTGRSTAKVTAQHAAALHRIEKQHGEEAARAYAEANRSGVAIFSKLVRDYVLRCDFEPADSFVYAVTDKGAALLAAEHMAAQKAGLPMQMVEEVGLPFTITAALRLPHQAQFQPVSFVASLAATLPGRGSFVFEGSRAIDWSESMVRTLEGTVQARHVIMATHLPLGRVGQFYAHTHPHMHAIMAVPVERGRAPAGMYISVDEPRRSVRRHRSEIGEVMLILTGPTFKHGDVSAEQEGFAELEDFAREHFGYAGGGFRWTNEDYAPRDGLPYVGWSGTRGKSLLVATGFDAWGLSNGAAAAHILADLCEDRENELARWFDAGRHTWKGIGTAAANAARVAGDFVGGHVRSHRQSQSLRPGEAAVVDIDGRATGVFRDEQGQFHAVSAVCSHMGCLLGWNPVDRSWDCSCHGSRFAVDGQVMHGPAVEPLMPMELSEDEEEVGR